jgi:hypothetical protein
MAKPSTSVLIATVLILMPSLGAPQELINPCELERGSTYRIDRQTPLMPEVNPIDPLEALTRAKKIPAGLSITIIGESNEHPSPWYRVQVKQDQEIVDTGWVNCVALMGQKLIAVRGSSESQNQGASPAAPPQRTLSYEIASTEDLSFAGARRLNLRVALQEYYSKDQILAIARSEVERITAKQDVNAISIMFYAPGTRTNGAWDVGAVDWAPNGDWSAADTVRAGDYRNFAYSITYHPPRQMTAKAAALSPSSDAKAAALSPSSEKGLFGAPLPASAELVYRSPGNSESGGDPSERYRLEASSDAIVDFFLREMPKHGWEKDESRASTERSLLYKKGTKSLSVVIDEGGTFYLIGH